MLIGEYTHTLDEKNRVSLPAKFRKVLGKRIVLVPGLDKSIALFSPKEWGKMTEKLSESSMLQDDNRRFARFMFGGATEVDVDASGRILVPDFLKERATLGAKIVLIGVHNRVELWNDTLWATYKKAVDESADALAEKLGTLGVL
jgi:MraZ protein